VRDLPRIQDGRLADVIHLAHADQHEQAEVTQSQIIEDFKKEKFHFYLFFLLLYTNL